MNRIAYLACALGLLLTTACRDDDPSNPGTDGGPGSDGTIPGGEVTIQEVQNDAMPVGTQVELKGVVVTAIDTYGAKVGDLWVQEPEGGPFSGVKVFGASPDQVALLQPGDIVDITNAIKHEACTQSAPCGSVVFDEGYSPTQVMGVAAGSLVITKVGTGAVPAPAEVDAKAIEMLPTRQERDAEWEKWEGVLIKVVNARQKSVVETFGQGADDQRKFDITGRALVESLLSDIGEDAVVGTCYDGITGIGDYFFDYMVVPRSTSDLVAGGTGCLAMAESVVAVQSASTTPEFVKLTNVVVTALDPYGNNSKGFWVADDLQGAEHNGVLVFTRSTIPAGVEIGARVDVLGYVEEYDVVPDGGSAEGDTVTEIMGPAVTVVSAPVAGEDPTPATTASVATLSNIGAAGEPWEGVLVQVGPVKATNTGLSFGQIEFKDNSNAILIMDDEAQRFGGDGNPAKPEMGKCYNVTGIMHVQGDSDIRTINPRSAADIVEIDAAECTAP